MELRSSEKEVSNLSSIYQNLYNSKLISNHHQGIKSWSTLFQYRRDASSCEQSLSLSSTSTSASSSTSSSVHCMKDYLLAWQELISMHPTDDKGEEISSDKKLNHTEKDSKQSIVEGKFQFKERDHESMTLDADQTLELLHSIKKRVEELQPKMQVFQKRMNERDPITDAPRYGEKTMKRVKSVLHTNQVLLSCIQSIFHTPLPLHLPLPLCQMDDEIASSTFIQILETISNDEILYQKEQEIKRKQTQTKINEQRKQAEISQQMIQMEKENIEKQRQLDEKKEIARKAKELREAKEMEKKRLEQAKMDRRRADKEYMASIEKGEIGVQIQLQRLKQTLLETNYQPNEYSTAIKSLCMIFKQISSHPDNENYRKIRKDHERFQNDIGRHSGGCELLIAAGFHLIRLDQEDDAVVFFMKEPSIENDMDGWSAWYDGLKSTLEQIEAEML